MPALDLVVRVAWERDGDVGREVGSTVCTTSAGTYDTMLSSITLYRQESSKLMKSDVNPTWFKKIQSLCILGKTDNHSRLTKKKEVS